MNPYESTGTVYIKQTHSTGNEDGNTLVYTVTTELSEPQNFSPIILAKNPCALFLYRNDVYQRVVSISDFNQYPATLPDTNGYLRKTYSSISKTNESDAAAYSKKVYEALSSFLATLRDFELALNNTVETDRIPNLNNSSLYNTIQEYNSVVAKIESTDNDISFYTAKKNVYETNKLFLSVIFTKDDVNTYTQQLSTLTSSMLTASTALSSLKTNQISQVRSNVNSVYTDVQSLVTNYDQINNSWAAVQSDVADPAKQTYKSNMNESLDRANSYSSLANASSYTGITNALNTMDTTIDSTKSTIDNQTTSVSQLSTALIAKMQLYVNLISQTDNEITAVNNTLNILNDNKNKLLAEKNSLASTLLSLTDNQIDLTDPMAIYNHRFFRWVTQ